MDLRLRYRLDWGRPVNLTPLVAARHCFVRAGMNMGPGLEIADTREAKSEAPASIRRRVGAVAAAGGAVGPAAYGLVAAAAVAFGIWDLASPLTTVDEGILLVYPEQVLAGRLPGKDFFSLYGPGNFVLLAGVFKALGPTVLAERLVGLTYHVAIATAVVRLSRAFGSRAAVGAGLSSALLLSTLGLGAYAWLGSVALSLWSLAVHRGGTSKTRFMLSGVLAGLTSAWRPETFVLALAPLPLAKSSRMVRCFLHGMAVGLLPLSAWLVGGGLPGLRDIAAMRFVADFQTDFEETSPLVWSALGAALIATILVSVRAIRSRNPSDLGLAIVSVALVAQSLQRVDWVHVVYSGCVTIPLLFALADARGRQHSQRHTGTTPWVNQVGATLTVAVVVFPGALLAGLLTALPVVLPHRATEVGRLSRTLPVAPDRAKGVQGLLDAVPMHVQAGSCIFVGARDMSVPTISDIGLYHLLPDYRQSSYFLYPAPGVSERPKSRLITDVSRCDALILRDVAVKEREDLFPRIPPGSVEVNAVIARDFVQIAQFGDLSLFSRRGL